MSSAKTAAPIPQKQYYTVKLETMAPVELTFRVFAETPEQAIEAVSKFPLPPLSSVKPNLSRIRRIKAMVYKAGTSVCDLVKKYM